MFILFAQSFCKMIAAVTGVMSLLSYSFFHSLMRSFVNCNSFVRSFLPFYSFHSFVRFLSLFVRSCIHSLIHSLILFLIDYPISFLSFFPFFFVFFSILFYFTLLYSIPFYPFHCVLFYSILSDSFWFT